MLTLEQKELIIEILKALKEGKEPKIPDYNVDKDFFGDTVEMMQNAGLISKANVVRGGQGNKVQYTILSHAKIELKGLDYLENNAN